MPDTAAWRALTVEPTLEPALPIIDPHHHLWQRSADDKYLLADVLADVDTGHNIVATVFIEFRTQYRTEGPDELKRVGETDFVEKIAAESATGKHGKVRIAAGIISNADLTLGTEVSRTLEGHMAASQRFRGIRHSAAWIPDAESVGMRVGAPPGLLADAKYRQGYAQLKRYNLVYDAWQLMTQLPEVVDLARAFPDQILVLNHMGGILGVGQYGAKKAEFFAAWKKNIVEAAKAPNIVCKLGGLGTPRCGLGWSDLPKPPSSDTIAKESAPWFDHCLEQFGPERCMFESNFPVDRASFSHHLLWNGFKRYAAGFSAAEKAALFHDNAKRIYRI
jgi:L-fuconolactonase